MKKKILIVEDDKLTQIFYLHLFKKTDYEIVILEDGDKIIDSVKKDNYSLLILDISLKNTYLNNERIDGIKLGQYIKEIVGFNHLPILLVTAYENRDGISDFLKITKADDYITKPIYDYNILLEKVNLLMV
jgi:CheY-like chemotaxis protein